MICSPSPTSARSRWTRCCRSSTSGAWPCAARRVDPMPGVPGAPKKGRRFGGDAAHQKAMFGNLAASLIAAEALVTTEAKAKALRPIVEKLVTKAKKANADGLRVYRQRYVVEFMRDKDMARKVFECICPR